MRTKLGGREVAERIRGLRSAARDRAPIQGLTHQFYRYPARFSPTFAATAIREFSSRDALVLDPYMGGGTTVVEALRLGRQVVGCDLNALGVFVARVKTTPLTKPEADRVRVWAHSVFGSLRYTDSSRGLDTLVTDERTRNLTLPRARPIKKLIALGLRDLADSLNGPAADFARCAILNVGQWALNGRKETPTLTQFRERLADTVCAMLEGLTEFDEEMRKIGAPTRRPTLVHGTAESMSTYAPFVKGARADLTVTSPPYPGVHVLYHRWQVDGRRETPAPYWITAQNDGRGAAFYNFADRQLPTPEKYFEESLWTLKGIRAAMKKGAPIIQMLAFSDPPAQVRRYLRNMEEAGFRELRVRHGDGLRAARIWRDVPNRAWHATLKGQLSASREVVLLHEAV